MIMILHGQEAISLVLTTADECILHSQLLCAKRRFPTSCKGRRTFVGVSMVCSCALADVNLLLDVLSLSNVKCKPLKPSAENNTLLVYALALIGELSKSRAKKKEQAKVRSQNTLYIGRRRCNKVKRNERV